MRRRLILHETDFFANRFSLPTLSMVEYSSEYLLFISYSTTCFWIDWVCVYNQGLRFKRNCIIARKQKRYKHGASLQSSSKINHMLICIPWKFTTHDQLALPSKFCSLRLILLFRQLKYLLVAWTRQYEFLFLFLNLGKVAQNSTLLKCTNIWHFKRVEINATKFKISRIHFNSKASVVKAPYWGYPWTLAFSISFLTLFSHLLRVLNPSEIQRKLRGKKYSGANSTQASLV